MSVRVKPYPYALVDSSIVRGLISRQCEMLRSLQLHPELAGCTNLSVGEIEQTIAAHQVALIRLEDKS